MYTGKGWDESLMVSTRPFFQHYRIHPIDPETFQCQHLLPRIDHIVLRMTRKTLLQSTGGFFAFSSKKQRKLKRRRTALLHRAEIIESEMILRRKQFQELPKVLRKQCEHEPGLEKTPQLIVLQKRNTNAL